MDTQYTKESLKIINLCLYIALFATPFSSLLHLCKDLRTVDTGASYNICYFSWCRSIGVSNFNVHHLQQLKLARPNHIPAGKYIGDNV